MAAYYADFPEETVYSTHPNVFLNLLFVRGQQRIKIGKTAIFFEQIHQDANQRRMTAEPEITLAGNVDILTEIKTVIPRRFQRDARLMQTFHKEIVIIIGDKVAAADRQFSRTGEEERVSGPVSTASG